ncbi:hypothetical protein [Ferruginibacter sp.]
MNPKLTASFLALSVIILLSCNKADTADEQPTKIDVSKQWIVDGTGNVIQGQGDGQWQATAFTTQELNLFTSLDTADLSGTLKPDSVFDAPIRYNAIIPNSFSTNYQLSFRFTNGFNGTILYKSVIVDSLMRPVEKKTIRLLGVSYPQLPQNPSVSNAVLVNPAIPVGKYRLYFTLSANSSHHFYKSWGNIQKTP